MVEMAEPSFSELLWRLQVVVEAVYTENAVLKAKLGEQCTAIGCKEWNGGALPTKRHVTAERNEQDLRQCAVAIESMSCEAHLKQSILRLAKQPAEQFPPEGKDADLLFDIDTGSNKACETLNEPDPEQMNDRRNGLPFFRRFSSSESAMRTTQELNKRVLRLRLAELLESSAFELFVGILIVLNTVAMAAEMQYKGIEAGYRMGYPGISKASTEAWIGADVVFIVIERAFTVIFTVELGVRLLVLRCRMLKMTLNWLDIFAVLISLLDWLASARTVVNPMMARMLRLAKLLRGLRIVKMARVLGSLHLLLKSIAASLSTLSWSVLLLIIVQCVAGMTLSQLVKDFINDDSQDIYERHQLFNYYGTFSRSMITMFEIHLANFAPACRVLVDTAGEEYAYVFLCYRCLAGFAILNVINAVFIQNTMKMAQQDHEIMLEQKQKAAAQYSRELKQLFKAIDHDGDGLMTLGELKCAVQNQPQMKNWMAALEIDTHDLDGLYKIIDADGDHLITPDEFFSAASRIKGHAKSVDMITLTAQTKLIGDKVDALLARSPFQKSRRS